MYVLNQRAKKISLPVYFFIFVFCGRAFASSQMKILIPPRMCQFKSVALEFKKKKSQKDKIILTTSLYKLQRRQSYARHVIHDLCILQIPCPMHVWMNFAFIGACHQNAVSAMHATRVGTSTL